ncbi:hypothetical protein C8J37_12328 [Rhizobium sp. PP-WC-1G-195]|nr:hypothetical protein C8J37_12328 [Rhizobium sp. PP-WC-1G-195]
MESFRLVLSNPTLPEITDGYEIQLHHSMGHDPSRRTKKYAESIHCDGTFKVQCATSGLSR